MKRQRNKNKIEIRLGKGRLRGEEGLKKKMMKEFPNIPNS